MNSPRYYGPTVTNLAGEGTPELLIRNSIYGPGGAYAPLGWRILHRERRRSGDLELERVEELTLIEGMSHRRITNQVSPHDRRSIRGFDGE